MVVTYREEPCRTALNRVAGMPFRWSLNPYTGCAHRCTFCYVRAFELRADRPADDRYGTSIRVKVNLPDVLRRELERPSWKRELVAVGTATDPYQPAEGRYRLTRRSLALLGEHRTPFHLITRNPMIVRDLDVLTEAARRAEVSITFSIPTLDHEIWRRTEPGTPPPEQRLRAIRRLVDAGIRAGVGMAPILPGLSDRPDRLAEVVRAARDAGATSVWAKLLYLKPGTREHFLAHLARDWPELLPEYERLYADRAYLPKAVAEPVRSAVADLRRRYGIADRRRVRLEPLPEPEQLAIALPVDRPAEVASPQAASPQAASPGVASPRMASPGTASSQAATPQEASPGVASPRAPLPPGVASGEVSAPRSRRQAGVAPAGTARPSRGALDRRPGRRGSRPATGVPCLPRAVPGVGELTGARGPEGGLAGPLVRLVALERLGRVDVAEGRVGRRDLLPAGQLQPEPLAENRDE